eukprot:5250072-Alexandrium_andersonii.AAC.1
MDTEACGAFPEALFPSLVALLGRNKGPEPNQQRPIAILPRVYRVWAKLRRVVVNSWRAGRRAAGASWECGTGAGR